MLLEENQRANFDRVKGRLSLNKRNSMEPSVLCIELALWCFAKAKWLRGIYNDMVNHFQLFMYTRRDDLVNTLGFA
jgi:hypothetical protein